MKNDKSPSMQVFFPMTTFVYGICTEDKLPEMSKQIESVHCHIKFIVPDVLPAPRSALAMPGAKTEYVKVLKIIVETTDDNYKEMVKKRDAEIAKSQGAH